MEVKILEQNDQYQCFEEYQRDRKGYYTFTSGWIVQGNKIGMNSVNYLGKGIFFSPYGLSEIKLYTFNCEKNQVEQHHLNFPFEVYRLELQGDQLLVFDINNQVTIIPLPDSITKKEKET